MAGTIPTTSEVFATCFIRFRWEDDWESIGSPTPGLPTDPSLMEAVRVTDSAAPAHATATFRFEYGIAQLPAIGDRPADTSWTVVQKPELIGYYVKVQTTAWTWYGVLMDEVDDRGPDITIAGINDGDPVATGVVTYTAFGLSILLEKMIPIRRTRVTNAGGGAYIGMAVPVNGGTGRGAPAASGLAGNRSPSATTHFDAESGEQWTAAQFLDHLFTYYLPTDAAGNVKVIFEIVGVTAALGYYLGRYDYEGKSLWQILCELIPRQRGLGFSLRVNNGSGTEKVEIVVWTYTATNVVLPGGVTILANPYQASLNLSAAMNVTREHVVSSIQNEYDQVRVYGAYRGSVFSIKPPAIDPDWSTELVDDYNAARSAYGDYDVLTDPEKAEQNAAFRSGDEFEKVFSWWKLPDDWPATVTDAATVEHYVFPALDADGDYLTDVSDEDASSINGWIPGLRFENFLPMKVGIDYSGATVPVNAALSLGVSTDYLKPPVWFDHELAEHLDSGADSDAVEAPRVWSVTTRNRTDWPGLIFEVSGGQQHFIAADLYLENGVEDIIRDQDRAVDHDDWVATVYCLAQERISAAYPADADVGGGDVVRVLELLYPDLFFDILIPGTVVGVEYVSATGSSSGDHVAEYVESEGGILRDDRKALNDIARMVWIWISTPRRILDIEFTAVNTVIPVGTLYTTLGGGGAAPVLVNSVVTSVSIELATGTVSFKTQAAELDSWLGGVN